MDYEKNIEKLNEIVNKLSNQKLPLDESVKLYESAEKLYKECSEYLSTQSGKVFKIKQELQKFVEDPMEWCLTLDFYKNVWYNIITQVRCSILVKLVCLEDDFKASKSISMKFLVFALVAQTGVNAGS